MADPVRGIVFADGHLHSNPVKGVGIAEIGRRFAKSGGWFVALVSLPPYHLGYDSSIDGYMKSVEILVRECGKARELGLRVACIAGIHPAAVEDEISRDPRHGLRVLEKAVAVLNHIAKLVREGVLNGFGEIGRPHYKASPEAFTVNNIVMRYALALAKDLDAVVHLHLEQGGDVTAIDVDEMLNSIGVKKVKVVLHHLDVHTARASQSRGLLFTVPGKYHLLANAFKLLEPSFMVESDFIDDPKRPGVSSYPWDIIENQRKLLSEGVVDDEYLHKLNIDVVTRVYGVEPP